MSAVAAKERGDGGVEESFLLRRVSKSVALRLACPFHINVLRVRNACVFSLRTAKRQCSDRGESVDVPLLLPLDIVAVDPPKSPRSSPAAANMTQNNQDKLGNGGKGEGEGLTKKNKGK